MITMARKIILLLAYIYILNINFIEGISQMVVVTTGQTGESTRKTTREHTTGEGTYFVTSEAKHLTSGSDASVHQIQNWQSSTTFVSMVVSDVIQTRELVQQFNTRTLWPATTEGSTTNESLLLNGSAVVNGTSSGEEKIPLWSRVFDLVQLASTLTGFLANVLTVTLHVSPAGFSRLILILFRHQSLVDSWVCAMASIVMLQPYNWLTGNRYFDLLVCHAWHGQAFYWGAVTLSTYNLVIISFERYMAVLHPFKHAKLADLTRKRLAFWFVFLYVLCLVITHGTYIQTRVEDGRCLNKYAFDGRIIKEYFFAFVIFTYVTTYFLPAVIMASVYSIISRKLHVRRHDKNLGQSNIVERAGSQVTKTAITVTIIFIVSIGYDLHYYLLGHTGLAVYRLNTPYQKVGVFLSNLNSCANPFVYAILMPVFRLSMSRTFGCRRARRQSRKRDKYADNEARISTAATGSALSTITTEDLSTSF